MPRRCGILDGFVLLNLHEWLRVQYAVINKGVRYFFTIISGFTRVAAIKIV